MESKFKELILAQRAQSQSAGDEQNIIQDKDEQGIVQDNSEQQEGPADYQAYKERLSSGHSLMNSIIYEMADGTKRHLGVSTYKQGIFTHHTLLSLIYHHCVVDMKGRNLDKLLEAINDKDIGRITEFHSEKHLLPPGHAPIITHMEIIDQG